MSTDHSAPPSPRQAAVDTDTPTTIDALFEGQLTLEQARKGYRFNVDSVLLSAFAHSVVGDDVLDVGAGVGVVGLALARIHAERRVTLVERQESLVALAQSNRERNGLDARVEIIHADIRELPHRRHHYDGAVMNPPYFRPGAGRESPIHERALARHQAFGDLHELIAATSKRVHAWAPVCVVYPARGLGEVLAAFDACQRRAVVVQAIQPHADAHPNLVLVAARQSRVHELDLLTPLVLYNEARHYTDEATTILRRGHWPWNDGLKNRQR